jgi:hypothetical protein
MEFLQANWFWILLGVGAVWFLFRRGGMGCGMADTARMSRVHRERHGTRRPLTGLTTVTLPRSPRHAKSRLYPLADTGAADARTEACHEGVA